MEKWTERPPRCGGQGSGMCECVCVRVCIVYLCVGMAGHCEVAPNEEY